MRAGLEDHAVFADEIRHDRFRDTPADQLLTGLRGKDVLLVFVESYGQGRGPGLLVLAARSMPCSTTGPGGCRPPASPPGARFLTSPTFGGISWLAHSTLQSGLWVDNQRRYDQLVETDRLTLSDAFKRAGWRTVGDVPSNDRDWPEGTSFYHYDKLYDRRNVGYHGPKFGVRVDARPVRLRRPCNASSSRSRDRRPLFAEVDLVSSHTPWTRIPQHDRLERRRRRLDLQAACRWTS